MYVYAINIYYLLILVIYLSRMESLYHDTHRKLQSIQHNFGRLEVDSRDPSSIHTAEHQLENQIDQVTESFISSKFHLDILM